MFPSVPCAINDFTYEDFLFVPPIPFLELILNSDWSQKEVSFKVFPSNGERTNFGNLQLIHPTELESVESWDENVKLFSTFDCLFYTSFWYSTS